MKRLLNWLRGPKQSKLFIDVLKEYIDTYILENDLAEPTKQRYDVYFRNYSLFAATARLQNLSLEEIRISHAEQFRIWLRSELKTCTIRHASRHVELLKRTTKFAKMKEYIVNDYLEPIKSQRDKPKKIIALEKNEVKKIMAYRFHSKILRTVADLFLFQCFTGLSYTDIYRFEIVNKKGQLWLEGTRAKTGEPFNVYVFPEAQELLIKYEYKMPRLSNQKYNEYLKEMAGMVGIKKHLTTHIGRKTHATMLSVQGAGTKSISLQLANTPRVCDESYIDKVPEIIESEINRLGLQNGLMAW